MGEKPTVDEVERLIDKHLSRQWAGDSGSEGIYRIIEILRWAARPEVEKEAKSDYD